MNTISRENEINIIGYKIPCSNDYIIGKTNDGYVVVTSDGIMEYSDGEIEEIYNLDLSSSNMERAGWTA